MLLSRSIGELRRGERVIDVGCGAGLDSLIAARMVGPEGSVVGVDMTPAMLERAERARDQAGITNVEFRLGHAEGLPLDDGWADVVISNGVLNLTPDKGTTFAERGSPRGSQLQDLRAGSPLASRQRVSPVRVRTLTPGTRCSRCRCSR